MLCHYEYSGPVATNRERALDAAIELLGTEGTRALTHLRVDERAGLPRGSTSNHFRTRAALLEGVSRHMVASELSSVRAAMEPASVEEFVDGLVELFEFLVGPNRMVTSARMALLVEASHDVAVRAALVEGRRVMREPAVGAFEALGAPDPRLAVDTMAVCFEGLFLHELARHAEVDPRPVIDRVVRACL